MPATAQVPTPELRKYCAAALGAVAMPVPPLAIGTIPLRLMLGLAPPLEASGDEAPTLNTPVLARVSEPPRASVPPPLKPEPVFKVTEGLASIALVTPVAAILMLPVLVMGPPVSPAPVFTLVTVPVPGNVCPTTKVITPLLPAILTVLAGSGFPPLMPVMNWKPPVERDTN